MFHSEKLDDTHLIWKDTRWVVLWWQVQLQVPDGGNHSTKIEEDHRREPVQRNIRKRESVGDFQHGLSDSDIYWSMLLLPRLTGKLSAKLPELEACHFLWMLVSWFEALFHANYNFGLIDHQNVAYMLLERFTVFITQHVCVHNIIHGKLF